MAEEFIDQGGVCSGSWWNRSRSALFAGGLSPCSAAAGDLASFRWPVESIFGGITSSAGSGWTETFLLGGGASNGIIRTSDQSDFTFNSEDKVHEIGSSESSQIHNDWKPVKDHEDWSTMSAFKDQIDFPAQISETYASHDISSSRRCPSTRKTFLLDQSPPLPGDRSDLPAEDCSSQSCFDDLSSASFGKLSSLLIPSNSSLPDPPRPGDHHFSKDTPHQNASMSSLVDIRARLLASSQPIPASRSLDEKLNWFDLIEKASSQYSQVSGNLEPALKRPRIETPSPLPTFKVRKEKLGDRITALQQLVSPFGKTDTASVLHEAIEYIKFLHDHVSDLSAHYVKSNETLFQHQQVCTDRALKDTEKPSLDLRSRGLCLVPISSTFPFTSQTPTDFWTPTFRGILSVNLT